MSRNVSKNIYFLADIIFTHFSVAIRCCEKVRKNGRLILQDTKYIKPKILGFKFR